MPLKVRDAWVSCVLIVWVILASGCAIQDGDTKRQLSAAGLIATPPSNYSTQKARYLGEKYKEKLNRLIEMIIANPKTSKLQFANNLGSSGGMGFFTHSAVKAPDERFLEVVVGTGENLAAGEYNGKVARLFSLYGRELLVILASDLEIYNDRELSGYGLNFTWRTLGSRASTERAVVYFLKEKVRAFLKEDIGENTLLAEAVIFVMEPEGQANLLSFRAPEHVPDVRAPIQEQVISPELIKAKPEVKPVVARGSVNITEGIKPATNAEESSASEKKKLIIASQNQTSSKLITPNESLWAKEEIVPDPKIETVVGEKIDPIRAGSALELAVQSDTTPMPATGVAEISTPAPSAVESAQPQVEAKPIKSNLQLESTGPKTSESNSSVDGSKEKERLELSPDMANSQIPASMRELRPKADSKGALGIHAHPELGSTETRSSSPKQAKPGGEVEKLGELASIPKIHPEPAYTETVVPTLITPSKLQNAEPETVERQGVLGHAKRIENIPETKSLVRPIPKALKGYIIQVSFNDRSEARRWADSFEQRGYAVSMTEAGSAESLRVRVGNFRLRDDAERQLKNIRENGLVGIILNLPQAYRPEVRSSLP
jgi:hypothetical protein